MGHTIPGTFTPAEGTKAIATAPVAEVPAGPVVPPNPHIVNTSGPVFNTPPVAHGREIEGTWSPVRPPGEVEAPAPVAPPPPGRTIPGTWSPAAASAPPAPRTPATGAPLGAGAAPVHSSEGAPAGEPAEQKAPEGSGEGAPAALNVTWTDDGDGFFSTGVLTITPSKKREFHVVQDAGPEGAHWILLAETAGGAARGRLSAPEGVQDVAGAQAWATEQIRGGWTGEGAAS